MKTKDRLPHATASAVAAVLLLSLVPGVCGAQTTSSKPTTRDGPAAPMGRTPRNGNGTDLNVTQSGTVELHVQGADLRRVLQLLSTQSKTNIIATKEVQGTVTADLYDVTFEEALEAVLKSAGFWYVRKGNFITVMTVKQYEDIQAAERTLSVRVFKLYYTKASDAEKLIAPALSEDGSISATPDSEVGITASDEATGGNGNANEDVLIVKDYPENLEQVAQVLKNVDSRPLQVLIEATVLSANLEEDNALGVDFNALAGVDFRSLAGTSNVYSGMTTGNAPADRLDSGVFGTRTDFNGDFDNRSFKVGMVFNNIALFIQALESVTDTTVLGNPKLLILNKQRGEILVGNRDGYITTTFTETTNTQTVEFLETGTKLLVRPFVGADGYVRMEIHPEVSDGGIDANGLPYERTTKCTSNVMVRDGHTIVIGGLFREGITNTRVQVPLLGNVPWLGGLFRRVDEDTGRQEVIVLITPHIIRHPIDEAACEQLKEQVLRYRMGTRQGLMFYGRDRMAQWHMRQARRHLAASDRGQALWNVKMARALEPRMIEAIHLQESLTHQAIWERESRFSSVAWIIQKMIMQDLGRPVEEVTPHRRPADGMMIDPKARQRMGIEAWPKPKELRLRNAPLVTPAPVPPSGKGDDK